MPGSSTWPSSRSLRFSTWLLMGYKWPHTPSESTEVISSFFGCEKEQPWLSLQLHAFVFKLIMSEGLANKEGPANDEGSANYDEGLANYDMGPSKEKGPANDDEGPANNNEGLANNSWTGTEPTSLPFYIQVNCCVQKFSLTFIWIFEVLNMVINRLVNKHEPLQRVLPWRAILSAKKNNFDWANNLFKSIMSRSSARPSSSSPRFSMWLPTGR